MGSLFTLGEAAGLLEKEPAWLSRYVARHPCDDNGRPYSTRIGHSRRFSSDSIKRLELAVKEADQRPVFLYFFEMYGLRCIKIGIAIDWHARQLNLQSASPVWIRRLLVINSFAGEERKIHQQLADLRMRGEWFRDDPRIRNFIQHCHGHQLFVIGEETDEHMAAVERGAQ